MDIKLDLNNYAQSITTWRSKNGFVTPSHIQSTENRDMMLGKLMLVVSELGEAAEAVRKADTSNFAEELADAFIRLMDITAACEIDIEMEIDRKMMINRQRPFRHGKQCTL